MTVCGAPWRSDECWSPGHFLMKVRNQVHGGILFLFLSGCSQDCNLYQHQGNITDRSASCPSQLRLVWQRISNDLENSRTSWMSGCYKYSMLGSERGLCISGGSQWSDQSPDDLFKTTTRPAHIVISHELCFKRGCRKIQNCMINNGLSLDI